MVKGKYIDKNYFQIEKWKASYQNSWEDDFANNGLAGRV